MMTTSGAQHLDFKTGLSIVGAALPSAPFPLPAAAFLALSAFRLGAGARLRLVDCVLTVPSCALLSLHQTYACGVSPSPNVTVTPSGLVVRRLTTPSLDADNVTVHCAGAAAPFPCLAESFPGDVSLLSYLQHAAQIISIAARTFGGTPPPVYGFLARDMALVEPAADDAAGGGAATTCGGGSGATAAANTTAGVSSSSNATAASDVRPALLGNPDSVAGSERASESAACVTIAWGSRLVLAGDGAALTRTVLDLAHSTSRLYLQMPDGKVEFRNLVLRNPPPGPPGNLPISLLRLPIWTAAFARSLLGSKFQELLTLTDCTVELPPEEVALLYGDVVLAAAAMPPALAAVWCTAGSQQILTTRVYNKSRLTDDEVYADTLLGPGKRSIYTRVSMRAVWPQGWVRAVSGSGSGIAAAPSSAAFVLPGPDADATPRNTAGNAATAAAYAAGVAANARPGGLGLLAGHPSQPSLCAVVAPGKLPPLWLGYVAVLYTDLVRPPGFDTFEQAPGGPGGVAEHTVVALAFDSYFMISTDRFYVPSYGQAQSHVTVPSMVLGEPLSLRLLDVCGVSSGVVIVGPRAALTLRWLVLVSLPAAGGFRLVPPGPSRAGGSSPSPPSPSALEPTPSSPAQLLGGGAGPDDSGRSVSGRRLQQLYYSSVSRQAHLWPHNGRGSGDLGLGRRAFRTPARRRLQQDQQQQQQQTGGGSATQGLAPALTNFTSCLWTFAFDRSPEALAADAAGGAGGRPTGLPRLQLDGVVLVVPEEELQLLGRVWAASADLLSGRLAFSAATDPGLAAALRAMLEGSVLLDAQHYLNSSSTEDRAHLRSEGMLELEQVSWCGWKGYNVTLITPGAAELPNAVAAMKVNMASYGALTPSPVLLGLVLPTVDFAAPSAIGPPVEGLASPAQGDVVVAVPSASPPPAARQPAGPLPSSDGSISGPASATQQPGLEARSSSGGNGPSADAPGVAPEVAAGPGAMGSVGVGVQEPQGAGLEAGTGGGSDGAARPGGSAAKAVPVVGIVVPCVGAAAIVCGAVLVLHLQRRRRARLAFRRASTGSGFGSDCGAGVASVARQCDGLGGASGTSTTDVKGASGSVDSPSRSVDQDVSAGETSSSALCSSAGCITTATSSSDAAVGGRAGAARGADRAAAGGRLCAVNSAVVGMILAMEDGRQRLAQVEAALLPAGASAPADAAAGGRGSSAAVAAGAAQLGDGVGDNLAASSVHDSNAPLLRLPISTPAVDVLEPAAAGTAGMPLGSRCAESGAAVAGADAAEATGMQPATASYAALPLTITGELGRGAQGVVYRGVWRGLDVAVKSVLFQHTEGGVQDPRAKQAVEEAAIAVSMAHPNIVATYTYQLQALHIPTSSSYSSYSGQGVQSTNDACLGISVEYTGSAGGSLYLGRAAEAEVWKLTLIQELCDASSLCHCLQSGRLLGPQAGGGAGAGGGDQQPPAPQPLAARTALLLACDIARGLAHLHERGVVHADLSSNNVLLQSKRSAAATARAPAPDGGLGVVAKLCDFGMSGRLDVEADATHLSGPTRRSSAYSAPELVAHGRSSPAGDVYAFAVVLWELALGLPLPAALARPESAGLSAWLSEQARLVPLGDDALEEDGAGAQAPGPSLASLALPPGLLWWPEHTPGAFRELAAECLQLQPRRRPSSAAVLVRLEQALGQHNAALQGGRQGRSRQWLAGGARTEQQLPTLWARLRLTWSGRARE
ncbi:hypothetical protein HXX76_009084 [Chlamydomonas incerta]|uniref:Protein kinase domain-containing protein n=1 Tax=Chlamydomonas incerta TaxID=51695 RepID=A0A835VWQ3_CHLIN|nr:hypothetical protein HXX76_009084 [Chlamydomonas incerta]|eukprot:KAG2432162.1 hypothetical protein HXX76_009084 [Chlamydomonas incerta]